jgi:hypothetical protein
MSRDRPVVTVLETDALQSCTLSPSNNRNGDAAL